MRNDFFQYFVVNVIWMTAIGLSVFSQDIRPDVPYLKDEKGTEIPYLTDADDDLLDVNYPKDEELFDDSFPKEIRPLKPNAGNRVYKDIADLRGDFSFDKKIGFMLTSAEGSFVSHFYLNLRNGFSMMDWEAIRNMLTDMPDAEITQILDVTKTLYNFIKSSEGNYSYKMGNDNALVLLDIQTDMLSKEFFRIFKKTGSTVTKGTGGAAYTRVEYRGTYDGRTFSVWLSDPMDVMLDTKYTYILTGFFGMGFIAAPSGKTYMVTGIEDFETGIFMTYIEPAKKSFSGGVYTPAGDFLPEASDKKKYAEDMRKRQNDIALEEDAYIRQLSQEQYDEYSLLLDNMNNGLEDFSRSSDLYDFSKSMEKLNDDFDMLHIHLNGLKKGYREMELNIQELRKNGGNYEEENSIRCKMSCNRQAQSMVEKYQKDQERIRKNYKNDPDKKNELLGTLYQKLAGELAIDCPCP